MKFRIRALRPQKSVVAGWGRAVGLALSLLAGGGGLTVRAAEFDHSHLALEAVLKAHVRTGRVNYAALKADPKDLDRYLNTCAAVGEAEYVQWTEARRLAFCINLYNASTLRLVVDHYPVASIKKIGGWFRGPWREPAVRVFGRITTLNYLEHEILRVQFDEPRLHFAIVCAALGCPRLRGEAYTADRLEGQLSAQAREFLGDRSKNRVDVSGRVVYLSPIFKWFEGDFARGSGSVISYVAAYQTDEVRRELEKGDFRIKYTDYDWALNDSSPK